MVRKHNLVPVSIPTKKFIKTYIINELGEKPLMSRNHHIGSKFIDLLSYKSNFLETHYDHTQYPVRIKMYIHQWALDSRGHCINETNINYFNDYLESHIKWQMRFLLDTYLHVTDSLEAAIVLMRDKIKIPEEELSYDLVKQDYYRHRVRSGDEILNKGGKRKNAIYNISIAHII